MQKLWNAEHMPQYATNTPVYNRNDKIIVWILPHLIKYVVKTKCVCIPAHTHKHVYIVLQSFQTSH